MKQVGARSSYRRLSTWVARLIQLVLFAGLTSVYLLRPKDNVYFWLAVILFFTLNLFVILGLNAWRQRESNRS